MTIIDTSNIDTVNAEVVKLDSVWSLQLSMVTTINQLSIVNQFFLCNVSIKNCRVVKRTVIVRF